MQGSKWRIQSKKSVLPWPLQFLQRSRGGGYSGKGGSGLCGAGRVFPTEVKPLWTVVSRDFQMRGCLDGQGMRKASCDLRGKGFGGSSVFV